jgi:hypothetical protein
MFSRTAVSRTFYGPTNRGTALSVLVHCIPPISRSAHVAGLVILRQTFVRRCHLGRDRQRATPFLKERDTTAPMGLVRREAKVTSL